jgi:ATP-dependent DNA ligase
VAKARPGIRFNEHIEGDGPTIFAHACKMEIEGIVSERKDRCIVPAARLIGLR